MTPITLVWTDCQHGLGVDGGRRLLRAAGDTRVVDQGVEPAGLLLDQTGGGGHTGVVGHVERDTEHIGSARAQLLHGRRAACVIPRTDPDLVAQSTQAGGDLVTNPLVRAGDERGLLIGHSFAPMCRSVACFPAGPIGPPAGQAVHLP